MIVFTTISPNINDREKKAMDSWCKKFKVYSVNTKEEIEKINNIYNDVNFLETFDTYDEVPGKNMIRLNTILNKIKLINPEIACIVNSDIILSDKIDMDQDIISNHSEDGIIIGSRCDIDGHNIEKHLPGYDVFIFKTKYLDILSNDKYVIGMSWWDYWAPCSFLFSGKKIFYIENELFYHTKHEESIDVKYWRQFGEYLYSDMMRMTNKEILGINIDIGEFQKSIRYLIEKHQVDIKL